MFRCRSAVLIATSLGFPPERSQSRSRGSGMVWMVRVTTSTVTSPHRSHPSSASPFFQLLQSGCGGLEDAAGVDRGFVGDVAGIRDADVAFADGDGGRHSTIVGEEKANDSAVLQHEDDQQCNKNGEGNPHENPTRSSSRRNSPKRCATRFAVSRVVSCYRVALQTLLFHGCRFRPEK